ncbi:MAG: hypothetical protein KC620_19715, partial [Myxococcales bacterium]|nr:hypothetical protein [Myxococcales bacterium]
YVSLGVGGELALDFGTDLRGCSVEVIELAGRDVEGYSLYVCRGPDPGAACLTGDALVAVPAGGSVSVDVPR